MHVNFGITRKGFDRSNISFTCTFIMMVGWSSISPTSFTWTFVVWNFNDIAVLILRYIFHSFRCLFSWSISIIFGTFFIVFHAFFIYIRCLIICGAFFIVRGAFFVIFDVCFFFCTAFFDHCGCHKYFFAAVLQSVSLVFCQTRESKNESLREWEYKECHELEISILWQLKIAQPESTLSHRNRERII